MTNKANETSPAEITHATAEQNAAPASPQPGASPQPEAVKSAVQQEQQVSPPPYEAPHQAQGQSTQSNNHYPAGGHHSTERRSAGNTLLIILGVALVALGSLAILPPLLGPLWHPIAAGISFLATLWWPAVLIIAGFFIIRIAMQSSKTERGTDMSATPHMPPQGTRLTRSRRNRMIGGVCGGIAEYFNMDPTIVRIITILLFLIPGVSWLIYIIAWILIPLADN